MKRPQSYSLPDRVITVLVIILALAVILLITTLQLSVGTSASIPPPDPFNPTNVTATETASSHTVKVSWTAPLDSPTSPITSYVVAAVGSTGLTSQCTTPTAGQEFNYTQNTYCALTNLSPDEYSIKVTAFSNKNKTGVSEPLDINVVDSPSVVTGVTADPKDNSAFISWDTPNKNGGASITSYTATAYSSDIMTDKSCTAITAAPMRLEYTSSCTILGLLNNEAYTVRVTATNVNGYTSAPSQPSDVVIPGPPFTVPTSPDLLTVTPGDGKLTVLWADPSDGGLPILAYTATAASASKGSKSCVLTKIPEQGGNMLCEIPGLQNATNYEVSVKASNSMGDSKPSFSINSTPATPPLAPTNLVAVPTKTSATLFWQASKDQGGSPITAYIASANPGGSSCTTATTSCKITDLEENVPYSVSVVAINAIGASPPINLNIITKENAAASTATVSLLPPLPIAATTKGSTADFFWLTSKLATDQKHTVLLTTGQSCSSLPTQAWIALLSCTISNLESMAIAKVRTTDSTGKVLDSNPLDVFPSSLPTPPTNFTVHPTSTKVTFSWSYPQSDGGSPVVSYKVVGSPSGQCVAIATFSCRISHLNNEKAYTFTITATTANGTSLPSTPITVTPTAKPSQPNALKAVAKSTKVFLSWQPPSGSGASPISYYTVTGSPSGMCITADLTCTIDNLPNDTEYVFTVAATNASGSGLPSLPVLAIPGLAPKAVTDLAYTPGSKTLVTWDPPPGPVNSYTATASSGDSCTTSKLECYLTINISPVIISVYATNNSGTGPPASVLAKIKNN